jgi:hypothetical protein
MPPQLFFKSGSIAQLFPVLKASEAIGRLDFRIFDMGKNHLVFIGQPVKFPERFIGTGAPLRADDKQLLPVDAPFSSFLLFARFIKRRIMYKIHLNVAYHPCLAGGIFFILHQLLLHKPGKVLTTFLQSRS